MPRSIWKRSLQYRAKHEGLSQELQIWTKCHEAHSFSILLVCLANLKITRCFGCMKIVQRCGQKRLAEGRSKRHEAPDVIRSNTVGTTESKAAASSSSIWHGSGQMVLLLSLLLNVLFRLTIRAVFSGTLLFDVRLQVLFRGLRRFVLSFQF